MGTFSIVNDILVRNRKEDKQLAKKWTQILIQHRTSAIGWIIQNVQKATLTQNIFIPSQLLTLLENKPFTDDIKQLKQNNKCVNCVNCVSWQCHVQEQREKMKDNELLTKKLTECLEMSQAEIKYLKTLIPNETMNSKAKCYQLMKEWGMEEYSDVLIKKHGWDDSKYWKYISMDKLKTQMMFREGHAFKFKMEADNIK